ncbi:MAG: NADP-dependent malic enzyme [Flavobacteriales bacterium]|nr:NADP-dependent malic enzyme [Flavobacteriales bacterium]
MSSIRRKDALDYHSQGRRGKVEVIPSKPYSSQRDLSLAYSPGVAEPCLDIAKNPEDVYKYTAKGNLVAVISNGTAVLGLGDIGPEASKPVMEGKGVLFKVFADLDCFDIEVDASDVDTFVQTVKAIAPTFGGINLEDIKAPEAFEIERRLKEELDIPVMHDDQHGTAIISGAALLNALELAEKRAEDVRLVVSGAGASAMACLDLYMQLGVQLKNIAVFDSKGHLHAGREGLSERKQALAHATTPFADLGDALKGADVFLGLSRGGLVKGEMMSAMAERPIVFALANPDPEIPYDEAKAARPDIIMATGRSDHPNQVNNVLGFPFIFRGAMDVRAKAINDEMKMAAVHAIAALAKENVPDEVNEAYDQRGLGFGVDFIIPKPMDPRLITTVAPAVAKAAMESGVAREPIRDWEGYRRVLAGRLGKDNTLVRNLSERARRNPKRIVFAEADHYKVLKAVETARDEGIVDPILLGNRERILELIETHRIELPEVKILDPTSAEEADRVEEFGGHLLAKRQRKGLTREEAVGHMRRRSYFASMLVETGEADAVISGLTRNYRESLLPALQTVGLAEGVNKVAGMYIIQGKSGPMFFADTTVNRDPSARELVDITLLTAEAVRAMRIVPRIAMLSYSNFGSANGRDAEKVREAVSILHAEHPDLIVDGEMQANVALNNELSEELFPFSNLRGRKVNTLIFPNLAAGNIAYKLIQEMGGFEVVGPVLLGLRKPFHILQMGSSVREIVDMVRIAAVDAQNKR